MAWFYKVSKGWERYAADQAAQLESSYHAFLSGTKDHVILGGSWRVDLEKMLQYRADDPTRTRAVKRESTIAPSPSLPSSSSVEPAAKKSRLLLDLVASTDVELTAGLSPKELTQVSERVHSLGKFLEEQGLANEPGEQASESSVVILGSSVQKSYGKGRHESPLQIKTFRVFARVGKQHVMLWVRETEVVNAEAMNVAYKLTTMVGNREEGDVLFPVPPFVVDSEGEQTILLMPLSDMQAIKVRCGQAADPRPANVWLKSVFSSLVEALRSKHGEDVTQFCEVAGETVAEQFEDKYLPSKAMTQVEMLKEKGMIP